MKKLFILTSVLALGAISAMAQGSINANNFGTGVNILIQDTTGVINGGTAVKIGNLATAAGFTGAGRGQVSFTLYAAANGASMQTLLASPIATESSSSTTDGIQTGIGSTFSPAGALGGQADEFIMYGVTANGLYSGFSIEAVNITPQSTPNSPPAIFGTTAGLITSFVLVPAPEPSTIALGGLGAAALLLFRRRK